jgi:hypothetical protein
MRTSILAIIAVAGTAVAFPAIAQQAAPSEQSQKMNAGDADKSMKSGGPDSNMQREADKGAKTKNSGESGFVADQDKPGTSARPPGRPTETTGSADKRK